MAVLPNGVKYLYVEHRPLDLLGERGLAPAFPIARAASTLAAAALILVCTVIVFRRGHLLDRKVYGVSILLLGLLVPYIISPYLPEVDDTVKIILGVAVIVAVWSLGSPADVLKWVPVVGSVIGTYSIIGGLVIPDYMNNVTDPTKQLIPNWELAGPFWHGNVLGIYSVLALAFTPLIARIRWRIVNGLMLCTAIVAAASRTALVAGVILVLWWIICWFRTMISVRVAGTALMGCCAALMVLLPVLNSNPYAFVGRGYVWASSLSAWRESPVVGNGFRFAGTEFRSDPASWAFHHGHNLVVDMLVRSGLVGMFVLVLILLAALRSTRAIDGSSHQIALFGYLIAFIVVSTTEAIWTLIPSMPLFPVVGLVFAVVICRPIFRGHPNPDRSQHLLDRAVSSQSEPKL